MANIVRQPQTISVRKFIDKHVESLIHGPMRKKKVGIHLGSWPMRFIVIASGYIYCYKDEFAVEPKSTFSLDEFNYAEIVDGRGNQWRILSNTKPERHKVLTFACVSDTDRKKWVDAVNREILCMKNNNGGETDASEEHYYDDIDDIDEEAERSHGVLGLNAFLKSKPIKAITQVVAKRYHDLKLGGANNKESLTKLDTSEPLVSDEEALSQAPEIPPARTLPASSSPDLPPGPVPPRIVKTLLKKEPPPLPPNGLLLPSEEPLSQTTALSPSCPRKNAPPPPKPPRLGNIPAAPEKQDQPPSNHAPSPPSLTEPKPEIEVEESVLPPVVPRLPPPRLVTNEQQGSGECSDSDEHIYVNIDDMYIPYEFPPTRKLEEKTLVDLCLISDPNPNRLRLNSILMSTAEYGAYFIRCSRKGDQKVLAFFSKAHKVNEYKIFQEDGQLTLDQNTKTPSFDTLESLLEFYTTTGLLIETDEHLGQGIHELVDVENAKLANESNT